jgi:hypothetical protein
MKESGLFIKRFCENMKNDEYIYDSSKDNKNIDYLNALTCSYNRSEIHFEMIGQTYFYNVLILYMSQMKYILPYFINNIFAIFNRNVERKHLPIFYD